MVTGAITTVAAARAAANEWLMTHMPDRFAAGIPIYDPTLQAWRIPVWLSYPHIAPLGPVGELRVEAGPGEVKAHTSMAEMKERALKLYEQHREHVDAPLL
jgi:hypothetical protein